MCLFKWMITMLNIVDILKKKTYYINTYHCRVKGHIFSQGIKLQRKKKLQIYSTWQMTLWILIWIVSDKTFVVIDHKFFTLIREHSFSSPCSFLSWSVKHLTFLECVYSQLGKSAKCVIDLKKIAIKLRLT